MKLPLSTHQYQLNTLYGSNTLYVALINNQQSSFNFTIASDAFDTLISPGHDFVETTRVQLVPVAGATLPLPLVINQDYYVVNANITAGTFKLSLTAGGIPIVCTTTGSAGTTAFSAVEQPLNIDLDQSLANWIRHETNYYGSNRQAYQAGSAVVGLIGNTPMAYTNPVLINFAPTTASITARYLMLIRSGSGTQGDASGLVDQAEDYTNEFIIAPNTIRGFSISQRKYNL